MVDVQPFDELAIDHDHALALGFGLGVSLDDAPRQAELLFGGSEHLVCCVELLRVDQRLSIETELRALTAGIGEAFVVVQV